MNETPVNASNPSRWGRRALEALIFVALIVAFQAWQLRDSARGPAPDIVGQRVDGSAFDLAGWRREHPGQAVLLYFWAEWCPICKTTAGNVTGVARDWPVTSIAVRSGTAEPVSRFMQAQGYRWPTLADTQGDILRRYGLPGTPAFAIIAPDGTIRFVSVGFTSELGLRLRLWWASRSSG